VADQVSVTPQEVDDFLASQKNLGNLNEEYHLSHILITVPEAASPKQVQAARTKAEQVLAKLHTGADFREMAVSYSDGQQALEGGDLGWRKAGQLPTLFSDIVTRMHEGEISDLIRSPSGFHILKLTGRRGEKKHIVRQTHARHILIRTNEVTSDYDARTRLERLRQRLLAGEDFAALAKANSDDRGSASRGGDLGWTNPGDFVPAFAKVMNELAPGAISEPFKSQFGWHIVQVLGRRDYDNTEQYQRARAREALRARKIDERLQQWVRRIRDEAYVEYRLEG
jgi:peptidyl-prolyl cis-trans isomerase SurA